MAEPRFGLIILNRNGMNNFVRQLASDTELDVQGQIVHVSKGDPQHDGKVSLFWLFPRHGLHGDVVKRC